MSDIKLIIKDRNGKVHEIDAPTDMSLNLMEIIKMYELAAEGTIGICGGMAMCASCQVYVHTNNHFGERNNDEEAMLDEAYNVKSNSRLGCQISISTELEGAEFELAPEEP